MAEQQPYRLLPDGRVLLDYGPMTLSVSVLENGAACPEAAIEGIQKGLSAFEELLPVLPRAKSFIHRLGDAELAAAPEVLQKMAGAVRLLQDPTFTPMAAVAGSFSDVIREEILRRGGARDVIVNNGGDISYSTADPLRPFQVGIVSDIALRQITHRLCIPGGQGTHGVATSGFGGRSLSRGIASAVTVIAKTCALADAAATDIANHAFAEDPGIQTCLARELDYDSDIAGLTVVREVGSIRRSTARAALENAFYRAKRLREAGMIQGAVVFVKNSVACCPPELNLSETAPQSLISQ